MFMISMPPSFSIGDTADVRINKVPTSLHWRDAHTVIIGESDARVILKTMRDGDRRCFICTDAGEPATHYYDTGLSIVRDDGQGWDT